MKIAATIARIIVGLIFFILGLNGFLHFIPAPNVSGNVMAFMTVLIGTKYYVVIFGVQVIAGLLLLVNQYVPLALVALAAVLVNIITFHVTMAPEGLPVPIVLLVLWFAIALDRRATLLPLLARKP